MKRMRSIVMAAVVATTVSLSPAAQLIGQDPTRVIVFIPDGAGVGHWSVANLSTTDFALRQFSVAGLVDTRGADHIYTGSAATATALATGVRTYRGAIGVGPDTLPLKNVLELAQEKGLATGLVTTGRITDATPAAFSTHVPSRVYEWEIARQLSIKNINVLLGGGRDSFEAWDRPDSTDLIALFRENYTVVETPAELRELEADSVESLFGLFTGSDMPAYPERSPSLSEMASAALAVLDKDPDGFFLLLETESTDTEAHARKPYDVIAGEMHDVNETIKVGLEYQRRHPETLFVVMGDHDTGGMAVQTASVANLVGNTRSGLNDVGDRLAEISSLLNGNESAMADSVRALIAQLSAPPQQRRRDVGDGAILVTRYTGANHTALMVPVFAKGPGAERFGGVIDNDRVGRLLMEAVGR
jgi:alkaline phosphatase